MSESPRGSIPDRPGEYGGLKATFDQNPAQYAAVRPGYPDPIIEAVIERAGPPPRTRILEIGCGTGNATAPFARRGYPIHCLEPGPNIAAEARERFRELANVTIEVITFEDWPTRAGEFDLVLAAQAFHWIDPELGFAKSAEALRPCGSLALVWNLAGSNSTAEPEALTELSEVIQREYARHAPQLLHVHLKNTLESQVAALQERLWGLTDLYPERYELRVPWCEHYDTERYLALLGTYSGHIALPVEQRTALFSGLRRAVEAHGGLVTKQYESLLIFARKR